MQMSVCEEAGVGWGVWGVGLGKQSFNAFELGVVFSAFQA